MPRKFFITAGGGCSDQRFSDPTKIKTQFLDAVFDELIEKRCSHYRQMMGCTPSGPSKFVP